MEVMRRYYEMPKPHELGERRTVTRFLLFPKYIGNEMRWLETATWEERCCMSGGEVKPHLHGWTPVRWVSP